MLWDPARREVQRGVPAPIPWGRCSPPAAVRLPARSMVEAMQPGEQSRSHRMPTRARQASARQAAQALGTAAAHRQTKWRDGRWLRQARQGDKKQNSGAVLVGKAGDGDNPPMAESSVAPGTVSTGTLSDWFTTPLGRYLLAREQAYFDRTLADIFG